MRLLIAAFAVCALALPLAAGDRCNQHMCPVAQNATKVGYEVVAELPLAYVDTSELDI